MTCCSARQDLLPISVVSHWAWLSCTLTVRLTAGFLVHSFRFINTQWDNITVLYSTLLLPVGDATWANLTFSAVLNILSEKVNFPLNMLIKLFFTANSFYIYIIISTLAASIVVY